MKKKTSIFLLSYFIISLSSISQEYTYTHYDIKDGLAGSTVYCAAQDKDGFMWFGTETGLSRFDGTQFVNFGIEQGLPDIEVLKIYCDSKNRIWLSLFKAAICYILNGKVHNQDNDSILKQIHLNGIAWQVCENNEGDILIREDKTLHIIEREGHIIDLNSRDKDNSGLFFSATKSSKGDFLICEDYNVYKLNSEGGVTLIKKLNADPLFMDMTVLGGDLVIWHKNRDAFNAFSVSTKKEESFRNPSTIINIQILDDSLICLNKIDGSSIQNFYTQEKINNVLPGKPVSSVFRDCENNFWFTTLGEGSFKLNSTDFATLVPKRKNGDRLSIFSLIKDKNNVIGGTDGCYVFSFEATNPKNYLRYKFLYDDEVKNRVVSVQSFADSLYVGTDERLFKVVSYKKTEIIDFINVKKLLLLNSDSLLVGTKNNLLLCNPNTLRFIDTFLNERVVCLNKIGDLLYIGTLNGLKVRNIPNNTVGSIEISTSIPYVTITALEVDINGTLWIGTYGAGLFAYKNGKIIATITQKDGLTSNICRCITAYGANLWVGTDKGINKISLVPQPHIVNKFTSTDGLPSDMINVILQDSELVFVGTPAGLTYFNSEKISANSKCNLHVTNILSGDDTLNSTNLKLSHKTNDIRFEFVAISYNSAGDIKYHYRLKGLKDTWEVTTSTSVSYPSLPSGNYAFEIKAINKYGVTSKTIAIPFEIEKQIWEKLWFRISCVVAVSLLIWFIMSRRIKQIRRKESEKNVTRQQIAELKQKALKSQINPHFIFNCLNSMQQYVVDNDIEGSNKFISNFSKLIRKTLEFSEKNEITLKEEFDYLETYLKLEQERFENKFKFNIRIQDNFRDENFSLPPLILQPIVENAVRHGVRGRNDNAGLIEIEAQRNNGSILIFIKDNGPGIMQSRNLETNESSSHRSMGMSLVEERIKVLNDSGTRKIFMQADEVQSFGMYHGTVIKIEIPV